MKRDIKYSLEALKNGQTILYPTDTVWGIGCDATNEQAVTKIYQIKQREESKSLVILVNSLKMLQQVIREIPEKALEILRETHRPTTVIYNHPMGLAKNVVAQDNSVAIRIVQDTFCGELVKKFGKPIVSTSANISGDSTPINFLEISESIKSNVDYIVKWRQEDQTPHSASRILKITKDNQIVIIRA